MLVTHVELYDASSGGCHRDNVQGVWLISAIHSDATRLTGQTQGNDTHALIPFILYHSITAEDLALWFDGQRESF
jgi:hypothetical protein